MATPSEDTDDYNQLVARIAGLSQENTDYENLTPFSVTPSSSSDDLVIQLQQKELDLKLTAELGKALLEKNEELKRRNEQLVEEFSQRLEELTQEKHELRLRLESIEGQYELTVRDLQHEVSQLRDDLADQEETLRVGERSHSQALTDAKRQNEHLAEQIHKVRGAEAGLQAQVEELREQLRTRRVSMQDYVHKVETLRGEIAKLTAIRIELDCRVNILTSERNTHVCSLEDAHDRIVALEQHCQEQQEQLLCQEREINELREQNLCLQDNVGHLALQSTSDLTLDQHPNSLFRELRVFNTKSTSTESLDTDVFSQKSVDLKQEVVEVYQLMMKMMNDLGTGEARQGHDSSSTHQVEPQQALAEVYSGGLQSLLRKLQEQMEHAIHTRVNQLVQSSLDKTQCPVELDQKILTLQKELDTALVALSNCKCHAPSGDSMLSAVKMTSTESINDDVISQSASEELKQEIVEVYQQVRQMVNDLGGGGMGQGHQTHSSTHQVEPQHALTEVQSGGLQSLLQKLREQMEYSVNIRVNQLRQECVDVYQQMKQMVNDLGGGELGQGHGASSTPQVEPQQAVSDVKYVSLQSLPRRLQEQMEYAVNLRVNERMRPCVEKVQHSVQLEQKVQELQNELDAALVALNDYGYPAHQSTSTSDLSPPADRGDDSLLSDVKATSTESLDDDVFSQSASGDLKQEIVEVYQQMTQMVNDLGGGEMGQRCTPRISTHQVEPRKALAEVQSGSLQLLLRRLRQQMEHAVNMRVNQHAEPAPERVPRNEQLEQKVEQLQNDLTRAEVTLNKLKVELKLREMELKRKSDDFMQLTSEIKLSLQQQELVTMQIERDRLQDQSAGVVTRDDIIVQARQSRDDAISRRNAMEVELARAKLDLMNLERQLMEAVQQKLQLSQQLEQWQMDMQELVDTQMMKRMELETKRVERSRSSPQSALRKFKFSWS